MYNRYIPQADGSYCRHSVPDKIQKPQQTPAPPKPKQPDNPDVFCSPLCQEKKCPAKEVQPAGGFLQRLLPGGLDTEDLIIILLLLLIAGDCREDQNFALLTLGLYLFM